MSGRSNSSFEPRSIGWCKWGFRRMAPMISVRSDNIFLFHGRRGKPSGSVLQLEELLRPQFQTSNFVRPNLLHSDPEITAGKSLEDLRILEIPQGAVIIGISLGEMLAAKLQE